MRNFTLTFIVVALAFNQLPVLADEGRIPVYQGGTDITEPGHYIVTRDFTADPGTNAIRILVPNVTLDLGGHTLTAGSTSDDVIVIADGYQFVTIRNGRLKSGKRGIVYDPSMNTKSSIQIEHVEMIFPGDGGIYLRRMEYVVIESCTVLTYWPPNGIDLDGGTDRFGGRITNNKIFRGATGISIKNGRRVRVEGNQVTRSYNSGIALTATWNSRVGNNEVLSDWVSSGIRIENGSIGNIVDGNIVTFEVDPPSGGVGSPSGILLTFDSHFNQIVRNLVTFNRGEGILVQSEGNQIMGNITGGNTSNGLEISGQNNIVDGNHSAGNNDCAIRFSNANGHVYRNNMLRGNTGGTVCGSANTDGGGNMI